WPRRCCWRTWRWTCSTPGWTRGSGMSSPGLQPAIAATPAPRRLSRVLHGRAAAWATFREGRVGPIGLALIAAIGLLALVHPLLLATVWDPAVYHPVTGFTRASDFPAPP